MEENNLPELPEPALTTDFSMRVVIGSFFTEVQMHEYALEAQRKERDRIREVFEYCGNEGALRCDDAWNV